MPYIGFATPVGTTRDRYDTCLRIGSFLGWHLSRNFSINSELTLDFVNPNGASLEVSNVDLDISLSPLFHLVVGHLDLVAGPKIGLFEETESHTSNGESYNDGYTGVMFGGNVGVLAGIRKIAVGALFSYTGRHYTSQCETVGGAVHGCNAASGTFQTVSLSGVILF